MKKVNLHQFNIPPDNIEIPNSKLEDLLVVCLYGSYGLEDINYDYCKVQIEDVQYKDNYTYLYLSKLESYLIYKYMDGFSPNLNKRLHIGHFSNLVYASAFSSLGVSKFNIVIYDSLK